MREPVDPYDAALDAVFRDLDANRPANQILATLRGLPDDRGRTKRARLLLARGQVMNRLSLPGEALADLHQARALFVAEGDRPGTGQAWRAIARVHVWRGDAREAALALLEAVAAGFGDAAAVADALLEAGRLNIEIGRPAAALPLLARGLDVGGDALAPSARMRGRVNLLQAAVASGERETARQASAALEAESLPPRLLHLAAIERARIATMDSDFARAADILADAEARLPQDESAYKHTEFRQASAELALARGEAERAEPLLRQVVERCAADDLAGPEIVARLGLARALDAQGKTEHAAGVLAAGLRRANARDLLGYADTLRARLADRPAPLTSPEAAPSGRTTREDVRFVRRRPLGRGGYGAVASAYDLETGRQVALKTLPAGSRGAYRARMDALRAEITAAARIRHPAVGRVFGLAEEAEDQFALVREFVEGPTLRDMLAKPPPPLATRLRLLAELARGLAAIHAAAIVHRDLKPENVVLRDGREPVIIDFGISAVGTAARSSGAGTAAYAAPEQRAGRRTSARADIYALGAIACELLSGAPPEPAQTGWRGLTAAARHARTIRRQLLAAGSPPALATLVGRMMAASPWLRPVSAQEIAVAFEAAAESHG